MASAAYTNEERTYYSMITIRRKNVLQKVTHEELSYVLLRLRGTLPMEVVDIGTHGNCKHFQLHYHIIVKHKYYKLYNPKAVLYPYYYIHIAPLRDIKSAKHYIHTDDHNNIYKLEQLLIENDYYYSTPKQTRSRICNNMP